MTDEPWSRWRALSYSAALDRMTVLFSSLLSPAVLSHFVVCCLYYSLSITSTCKAKVWSSSIEVAFFVWRTVGLFTPPSKLAACSAAVPSSTRPPLVSVGVAAPALAFFVHIADTGELLGACDVRHARRIGKQVGERLYAVSLIADAFNKREVRDFNVGAHAVRIGPAGISSRPIGEADAALKASHACA
jgi:hypothetical protein